MAITMKIADKKLEKLGFAKVYESEYVVEYDKPTECGYVQRLDLIHKASGNHICISSEERINDEGFNNAVGMTVDEMRWARRKMRELGWL